MALDFPASPSVGQIFPVSPPPGTPQYVWDGVKWTQATNTVGGGIASSIAFVPAGNVSASNVQTAITEVDAEKVAKSGGADAIMTGHLTLPVGPAAANAVRKDYVDAAVTASQVFTPGGNIAATTVQGAIAELDAEKVKKSGDIMTGMLQINQAVGNTTSLVNFTDGTHYEFVTYQDASGYAEWDIDGAGPGGFGPGQSFSYARGTLSAPQAVHANDEVGFHYYYFHDGLNWLNAASLGAVAEGDPVPGVGTPTALSFKTGASNDSGIERLRIKSDGHVLLTLDPVVGLGVATKQYVDAAIATRAPIATISTSAPTGGVNGDVWYQVVGGTSVETYTPGAIPIIGQSITPFYSNPSSVHYGPGPITAGALAITGQIINTFFAVGGVITTISRDGINVVFAGTQTTGLNVDGVSPWIVAPPGGTTLLSVYITPTEPRVGSPGSDDEYVGFGKYLGAAMVDPQTVKQGMDNRVGATGVGPGQSATYDAALSLVLPATVDHYGTGSPKTIWCYRGCDVVQLGGSYNACYAMLEITVYASNPGALAIKPTGMFVATGKPVYTTADINYSLYTPVTRPVGFVEPDWTLKKGFLNRPLVRWGPVVYYSEWCPFLTQDPYPAYQAIMTNMTILGAISNSPSRTDLINRVVRDGLMAYSMVALGYNNNIALGGFGPGLKGLAYFAGRWLGVPAMCAKPADATYGAIPVEFYHEDGCCWQGATEALYGGKTTPSLGSPLTYPDNHDFRDAVFGLTDPTGIAAFSGTAQAGTTTSITLAAGTPAVPAIQAGYLIFITGGTGSGQSRLVQSWDAATKLLTISTAFGVGAFSPAPNNTSTYSYSNAGTYETIGTQSITGLAIALVLAGESSGWGFNPFFKYCKRWIDENGLIRYPYRSEWQFSNADTRKWGDTSNWTKLFYTLASSIWPTSGISYSASYTAGSIPLVGQSITPNWGSSTYSETGVAFDGSVYIYQGGSGNNLGADSKHGLMFFSMTFATAVGGLVTQLIEFGSSGIVRHPALSGGLAYIWRDVPADAAVIAMNDTVPVAAERLNLLASLNGDSGGVSRLWIWRGSTGSWIEYATDTDGGGNNLGFAAINSAAIFSRWGGGNNFNGTAFRAAMWTGLASTPDLTSSTVRDRFSDPTTGALVNPATSVTAHGTPIFDWYGNASQWNAGTANHGSSAGWVVNGTIT